MGWFSITSTIKGHNGASVPFAFECSDADNLEELSELLLKDGHAMGYRYRVNNHDEKTLTERRKCLLTESGIATAMEFEDIEKYRQVERFR